MENSGLDLERCVLVDNFFGVRSWLGTGLGFGNGLGLGVGICFVVLIFCLAPLLLSKF